MVNLDRALFHKQSGNLLIASGGDLDFPPLVERGPRGEHREKLTLQSLDGRRASLNGQTAPGGQDLL